MKIKNRKYVIVNGCIVPINNDKDYQEALHAAKEAHGDGIDDSWGSNHGIEKDNYDENSMP